MDPLSGDVRQPQGFRLARYRIATQTNMESLKNTGGLCGFHFDLRHFQSKLACQSFRVQRLALSDFDVVRFGKFYSRLLGRGRAQGLKSGCSCAIAAQVPNGSRQQGYMQGR